VATAESTTSSKREKRIAASPTGHKGYVFSNAWVHQTVESMCIALMVDPQGDSEIIKAQELMRATWSAGFRSSLRADARWLPANRVHSG
jgi:hypothetical protein